MFEIIGLAIGGFLGFLISDFLVALDPIRQTARQAIAAAREKVMQLLGSIGGSNPNPLVAIGIAVVVVVIVFWLLGFSSAMLLGVVLGVIYKEEVGNLPFVSIIAQNIKNKISGPR